MTTTETAKMIREQLPVVMPDVAFSVRKVSAGVIYITPKNDFTREQQRELNGWLQQFRDWDKFNTNHIFFEI